MTFKQCEICGAVNDVLVPEVHDARFHVLGEAMTSIMARLERAEERLQRIVDVTYHPANIARDVLFGIRDPSDIAVAEKLRAFREQEKGEKKT